MSLVDTPQHNATPTPSTTTKLDPSLLEQVPPPPPLPSLVPLDFAPNPVLRQVTTLLRRIWLLDPPLSGEELADAETVGACLQSVTQIVSSGEDVSSSSSSSHSSSGGATGKVVGEGVVDDDDDETWKSKTQFRLLDDPVVVSAEKEKEGKQGEKEEGEEKANLRLLKSVVSPWRQEIYDVYRHVFADLWRMMLVLQSQQQQQQAPRSAAGLQIGKFEPTRGNAVSVGALPRETQNENEQDEKKVTTTTMTTMAFETDTFMYPVWVNPKAKITFSSSPSSSSSSSSERTEKEGEKEGEEGEGEGKHSWKASEAKTWTTGLWVHAGKSIVLRTVWDDDDDDGDGEKTGLAAVFVTGHCDERG